MTWFANDLASVSKKQPKTTATKDRLFSTQIRIEILVILW
jgi:hypothetical protein